jgi:hypothetical protein
MRLLASTFTSTELNQKGFALYASFRPQVEQWGGRSVVKCKSILDLRKESSESTSNAIDLQGAIVKEDVNPKHATVRTGLTLEEYEAAIEQDEYYETN